MVCACPNCGKRFKADDKLVGKFAVCPACKQRFTIAESKSKPSKTQNTKDQSTETEQTADLMSKYGIDSDRPDSVNDAGLSLEKNPPLTKSEQDFVSETPVKLSKGPTRKNLFMILFLAFLVIFISVVIAIMFLYPEKQGPLTVYVVPHVDDIDGGIDPDWFFFFDHLRQWHDRQSIPGCFAFYAETMNDKEFNRIIADMYASKNIELVLKGEDEYKGKRLDQMSSIEVQKVLEAWQDKFVSELQNLGYSDIQPLVTYNQLMMRLTEAIRDAARESRFKICLELGESEHGYIDVLPDFDITQYSVCLTRSGQAGPDEDFKTPDEIIQELLDFQIDHLIYINGIKVVPLLCNQQDFRQSEDLPVLDEEKWQTYTSLLRRTNKDSRICLLTAREVFDLRHGVEIP